MVKKLFPENAKSVIWDTFYEIILFAKEEKRLRYEYLRNRLGGKDNA